MEEKAKWTWEHSTVNYILDARFNFLFSDSRDEKSAFQHSGVDQGGRVPPLLGGRGAFVIGKANYRRKTAFVIWESEGAGF